MIQYITNLDAISPENLEGFFVGWRAPLTREQHFEILKNSSYFVVALDTEAARAVGFVNALSDGVNFAFLPMLEVLPEYQHKGIGSMLMEKLLELLQCIQCVDLTCDVDMQTFYERFGMLKSHGMVIRRYL